MLIILVYCQARDKNTSTLLLKAGLPLHPGCCNMNTDNHERLGRVELNSPQSPAADWQMSISVYLYKLSGSEACLGEPHSSANANSFLRDRCNEIKMVPWYSKRIRMLTAFLILFIVLSLVMTGLFVWRVIYYGNDDGITEQRPHINEVNCI